MDRRGRGMKRSAPSTSSQPPLKTMKIEAMKRARSQDEKRKEGGEREKRRRAVSEISYEAIRKYAVARIEKTRNGATLEAEKTSTSSETIENDGLNGTREDQVDEIMKEEESRAESEMEERIKLKEAEAEKKNWIEGVFASVQGAHKENENGDREIVLHLVYKFKQFHEEMLELARSNIQQFLSSKKPSGCISIVSTYNMILELHLSILDQLLSRLAEGLFSPLAVFLARRGEFKQLAERIGKVKCEVVAVCRSLFNWKPFQRALADLVQKKGTESSSHISVQTKQFARGLIESVRVPREISKIGDLYEWCNKTTGHNHVNLLNFETRQKVALSTTHQSELSEMCAAINFPFLDASSASKVGSIFLEFFLADGQKMTTGVDVDPLIANYRTVKKAIKFVDLLVNQKRRLKQGRCMKNMPPCLGVFLTAAIAAHPLNREPTIEARALALDKRYQSIRRSDMELIFEPPHIGTSIRFVGTRLIISAVRESVEYIKYNLDDETTDVAPPDEQSVLVGDTSVTVKVCPKSGDVRMWYDAVSKKKDPVMLKTVCTSSKFHNKVAKFIRKRSDDQSSDPARDDQRDTVKKDRKEPKERRAKRHVTRESPQREGVEERMVPRCSSGNGDENVEKEDPEKTQSKPEPEKHVANPPSAPRRKRPIAKTLPKYESLPAEETKFDTDPLPIWRHLLLGTLCGLVGESPASWNARRRIAESLATSEEVKNIIDAFCCKIGTSEEASPREFHRKLRENTVDGFTETIETILGKIGGLLSGSPSAENIADVFMHFTEDDGATLEPRLRDEVRESFILVAAAVNRETSWRKRVMAVENEMMRQRITTVVYWANCVKRVGDLEDVVEKLKKQSRERTEQSSSPTGESSVIRHEVPESVEEEEESIVVPMEPRDESAAQEQIDEPTSVQDISILATAASPDDDQIWLILLLAMMSAMVGEHPNRWIADVDSKIYVHEASERLCNLKTVLVNLAEELTKEERSDAATFYDRLAHDKIGGFSFRIERILERVGRLCVELPTVRTELEVSRLLGDVFMFLAGKLTTVHAAESQLYYLNLVKAMSNRAHCERRVCRIEDERGRQRVQSLVDWSRNAAVEKTFRGVVEALKKSILAQNIGSATGSMSSSDNASGPNMKPDNQIQLMVTVENFKKATQYELGKFEQTIHWHNDIQRLPPFHIIQRGEGPSENHDSVLNYFHCSKVTRNDFKEMTWQLKNGEKLMKAIEFYHITNAHFIACLISKQFWFMEQFLPDTVCPDSHDAASTQNCAGCTNGTVVLVHDCTCDEHTSPNDGRRSIYTSHYAIFAKEVEVIECLVGRFVCQHGPSSELRLRNGRVETE